MCVIISDVGNHCFFCLLLTDEGNLGHVSLSVLLHSETMLITGSVYDLALISPYFQTDRAHSLLDSLRFVLQQRVQLMRRKIIIIIMKRSNEHRVDTSFHIYFLHPFMLTLDLQLWVCWNLSQHSVESAVFVSYYSLSQQRTGGGRGVAAEG